ncbi:MAG: Flp pilus assembly protein CpaB [Candidatus Omnitrophica bacterium]|nr:Flp pilus assembly protein CpaB [Candidatus Omnitrophota bacterium]
MENKRQVLLIVLAVVAGIVATVLTGSYVTKSIGQQTQQLKEEYEAKQKETANALQQQSEQRMAMLAQEIQRVKAEQDEAMQKQAADLQAKIQVQAQKQPAEVIKRPKPSLAMKTPSGKRALTIMVDSLAAVGGLLNPGDFIDVIAHLNVPLGLPENAPKKNTVTAMVFQGLEVLAVNTNLEETGKYYDEQQGAAAVKLTVAVDPEEAGLLAFADKNGKLEMALRSPQETDRQMVKASTWKTLADYVLQNQGAEINLPDELKEEGGKTTKQPEQQRPGIQIFRGGKEL